MEVLRKWKTSLTTEIEKQCNDIEAEEQVGFRTEISTVDHLFYNILKGRWFSTRKFLSCRYI